jgi:hypothetical protein
MEDAEEQTFACFVAGNAGIWACSCEKCGGDELAASHVDGEVVASVHLDTAPNREQTWGHSHTLVHSLEHDFLENFGFTSLLNPYEPGPYVNLEAYLHVETEEEVDHC